MAESPRDTRPNIIQAVDALEQLRFDQMVEESAPVVERQKQEATVTTNQLSQLHLPASIVIVSGLEKQRSFFVKLRQESQINALEEDILVIRGGDGGPDAGRLGTFLLGEEHVLNWEGDDTAELEEESSLRQFIETPDPAVREGKPSSKLIIARSKDFIGCAAQPNPAVSKALAQLVLDNRQNPSLPMVALIGIESWEVGRSSTYTEQDYAQRFVGSIALGMELNYDGRKKGALLRTPTIRTTE